ncbi:rhodanese family protein [Pseudorhodoplanes sp.]|uniref:rhodanese family protein n=1 Tax=Pseudorhodoplanes sp. TaxID=1934341 RepID=UPI00391C6DF4
MTALTLISPQRAAELMREGAVLVDIRERDEHARERIEGARHHALSLLDREHPARPGDDVLIFHCRSGARTTQNAPQLAKGVPAGVETYVLDGGIEAWKKAGLPVTVDRKAPLPIMRQVQIAAGSLVVLGTVLGATVSPGFYLLAGFVGAGLVFAGVTGFCGMANVLALMPWNRQPTSSAA